MWGIVMRCHFIFLLQLLYRFTIGGVFRSCILLLVLWSSVGLAEAATPDCAEIGAWSAQFDAKQTYQAAPSVTLPQAVGTEQFRSLFGIPIEQWSKKDFSSFNQLLKTCQGKLFSTNRKLAKKMNGVRKQFRRIERSTQALGTAAKQGSQATDTIAALPDTESLGAVLSAADAVLQGQDGSKFMDAMPRQAVQALRTLSRVYPQMPASQSTLLQQRIAERRVALQTALAAEKTARQQATERARLQVEQELEAARKALADATAALEKLPITPDALPELERLSALPALARVPDAENQAFRDALQKKREAVDVIVQRERSGKITDTINQQIVGLNDFEIEKLPDLGVYRHKFASLVRLVKDPKNSEAVAASQYAEAYLTKFEGAFNEGVTRLLPAFERRVEAFPATAAGQQQLRNAVTDITGVGHGVAAMKPYYAAVKKRYQTIVEVLRHAEQWFAAAPRLEQLLPEDEVDEVTVSGLRPGMREADALATIRNQWHYVEQPTMSLTKSYGPGREAAPQLKKSRRNGGVITFKAMDGKVGQITLVEHYKPQLELAAIKDWLFKRFGKADNEQAEPSGFKWSWKDGEQYLQVAANNQVDFFAASSNYRSKLSIALWNEDYKSYLVEVDKRCAKLRKTPRSEFSMDDSMFFMKAECPLIDGHPIEPGL